MQRAEPRQEEVTIKNLIFNFRYEIQKVTCRYYVTSRLLTHSKLPLLQWSLSTSDMNKTIILAPDTLNFKPPELELMLHHLSLHSANVL